MVVGLEVQLLFQPVSLEASEIRITLCAFSMKNGRTVVSVARHAKCFSRGRKELGLCFGGFGVDPSVPNAVRCQTALLPENTLEKCAEQTGEKANNAVRYSYSSSPVSGWMRSPM